MRRVSLVLLLLLVVPATASTLVAADTTLVQFLAGSGDNKPVGG